MNKGDIHTIYKIKYIIVDQIVYYKRIKHKRTKPELLCVTNRSIVLVMPLKTFFFIGEAWFLSFYFWELRIIFVNVKLGALLSYLAIQTKFGDRKEVRAGNGGWGSFSWGDSGRHRADKIIKTQGWKIGKRRMKDSSSGQAHLLGDWKARVTNE